MNFQITTALMATQEFGKGPTEFGLLGSIMAIGSLAAALLSARRAQPWLRHLPTAMVGFVAATGAAAAAPTYTPAPRSCPWGLSRPDRADHVANAMVQRGWSRTCGRVMALYMAIFSGGTSAGAPIIGWVGDVLGARWTIAIGTVAVAPPWPVCRSARPARECARK